MSRRTPVSDTVSAVTSAASQPLADDLKVAARPDPRLVHVHRPGTGAMTRIAAWWGSPASVDAGICLVFVLIAFWFTKGLWPEPSTHAIADNANDQALIEWFLAQGVLFWKGQFSLVTDKLNSPDGVNLMSNASHILQGIVLAPVTALFGAAVSFALLVALNLAATSAGWYLLFRRCLRLRRWASAVGAGFCGFAPGMISQSNSHLHITAQWLVPVIVYCVIRLARASSRRDTALTAAALGVTLFLQVLLGEEVLLLTGLTLLIFGVTYAMRRRGWARSIAPQFLLGSALALVVAGVLLAYPLWIQFHGPQHTPNAPFGPSVFYADVATYPLFSPLSIAGTNSSGHLATSSAEYNSYFGLPILIVIVALLIWRWRATIVPPIAVSLGVMTLLSFGPTVTFDHHPISSVSLYDLVSQVPIVNSALPTRYALALIPLVGLLLADALDASTLSPGVSRYVVPVAIVAALAPMIPLPVKTTTRAPVPQFVTSGDWRQCAPEGGVIAPVPLPQPTSPDAMRWPAAADDAFAIPEGFFIGPYGANGLSSIGRYPSSTSQLLQRVAETGVTPQVDARTRAQTKADLAYWRADCVALAHVPNENALHATLDELLGPGRQIDDTWTWKINR
jgi:hypothetical protein